MTDYTCRWCQEPVGGRVSSKRHLMEEHQEEAEGMTWREARDAFLQ